MSGKLLALFVNLLVLIPSFIHSFVFLFPCPPHLLAAAAAAVATADKYNDDGGDGWYGWLWSILSPPPALLRSPTPYPSFPPTLSLSVSSASFCFWSFSSLSPSDPNTDHHIPPSLPYARFSLTSSASSECAALLPLLLLLLLLLSWRVKARERGRERGRVD